MVIFGGSSKVQVPESSHVFPVYRPSQQGMCEKILNIYKDEQFISA